MQESAPEDATLAQTIVIDAESWVWVFVISVKKLGIIVVVHGPIEVAILGLFTLEEQVLVSSQG
ncbi:hypothetical protein [Paenibacillus illinoisensis]|uniref:hypothetical protein n=1 Tax=Paenibacillus illinoisensis TaxID=59845 RepID=UPI00203C5B08|nr:hypothetical protein [Paenibacillus illinoisensis]MCM3204679.1 hypothetical protein [Paenibacillus illinoisensis]